MNGDFHGGCWMVVMIHGDSWWLNVLIANDSEMIIIIDSQ